MTKQRKQENEAVHSAEEDDQASTYKKNKIEMGPIQGRVKFLQKPFEVSEDQAPMQHLVILQLMTMLLIEDLQDKIKNETKDEEAMQLEYESEMAAAKKLEEELT